MGIQQQNVCNGRSLTAADNTRWMRGPKRRKREPFNSECFTVLQELTKRGTAGSPLEDKQADKHSFPGAISSIPYARSPLPHSKSGSLHVTDGLFSSHKHGTPLETAQPLSTVLYLAAHTASRCTQTKARRCCL